MSKNHNGVLRGMWVVAPVFWLCLLFTPHVSAQAPRTSRVPSQGTSVRSVSSRSTTKGVRTMAYKRQRVIPRAVSLPPEIPSTPEAEAVVQRARSALGARYRWGGTSLAGFDCSGLVRYSLGEKANNLPRSSYAMYSSTPKTADLRPGDIIFMGWGSASHVGIYAGNGTIIHASTYGRGVREDSLSAMAASLGFLGVARVI